MAIRSHRHIVIGAALVALIAISLLVIGVSAAGISDTKVTTASSPAVRSGRSGLASSVPLTEPASAGSDVDWQTQTVDMTFDGIARSFLLSTPRSAARGTLPVLVYLHGHSVTPAYEENRTGFEAVTGPAILVFPAGTSMSWNAGHCCDPADQTGVNDVGFVEAVLARVLAMEPAADRSHVYLAGYSNGGKLALSIACADPSPWRGIAVYGATSVDTCQRRSALSMMISASSDDPELTIGPGGSPHVVNGFEEPTVSELVGELRSAAGCSANPSTARFGTLHETVWTCSGGRRVELALYSGLLHTWPAGDSSTPSGAQAEWSFFRSLR